MDPATSEIKQVEQNLKSLNRILDQLESVDNDVIITTIIILFIFKKQF